MPRGGPDYLEFNFSPSTSWAAYAFDRYRKGMREFAQADEPQIAIARASGSLALAASADLDNLPSTHWHVGLSAVIEEEGGVISYWALNHPPGKPDFHHPACFTLELPAPERR